MRMEMDPQSPISMMHLYLSSGDYLIRVTATNMRANVKLFPIYFRKKAYWSLNHISGYTLDNSSSNGIACVKVPPKVNQAQREKVDG